MSTSIYPVAKLSCLLTSAPADCCAGRGTSLSCRVYQPFSSQLQPPAAATRHAVGSAGHPELVARTQGGRQERSPPGAMPRKAAHWHSKVVEARNVAPGVGPKPSEVTRPSRKLAKLAGGSRAPWKGFGSVQHLPLCCYNPGSGPRGGTFEGHELPTGSRGPQAATALSR